ncbi:trehalose-phosphatase [Solicola gregarius]|uniref:Trehalose 6-phosphate phosphatase n=1 Tax=Solicola gregarius TaxID=2908642 RepID=A0AA46YMS7_9ACTN|nr:trehalose-phosphatase [Solicola gregarius]UYM06791.1 trehalose-phosphatase [Solicola gregarius]
MTEIVTAAGADAMAAIRRDPAGTLLALDFDGTLAPIVDDPAAARANPGAIAALGRLGPVFARVAIVTGRPAEAALRLGRFAGVPGLEAMTILGQYGAERWDAPSGPTVAPPPPRAVGEVEHALPDLLEGLGLGDLRVEHKSRAIVLHTRGRRDPDADLATLDGPVRELAARHGLMVEPGKSVVEIRSSETDKGVALRGLQRETGARQVVFAGDDLGDLPAYDAVDRMRTEGIPGLLVASASHEQDALVARSDLVLPGPAAVAAWLGSLADDLAA